MNKTQEYNYIKAHMINMSRPQKETFLNNSNLTDRELKLLSCRFIQGLSLKECSDLFGLEINTISKNQQKAINKLYQFLINN